VDEFKTLLEGRLQAPLMQLRNLSHHLSAVLEAAVASGGGAAADGITHGASAMVSMPKQACAHTTAAGGSTRSTLASISAFAFQVGAAKRPLLTST
jgi:hypothetical protein